VGEGQSVLRVAHLGPMMTNRAGGCQGATAVEQQFSNSSSDSNQPFQHVLAFLREVRKLRGKAAWLRRQTSDAGLDNCSERHLRQSGTAVTSFHEVPFGDSGLFSGGVDSGPGHLAGGERESVASDRRVAGLRCCLCQNRLPARRIPLMRAVIQRVAEAKVIIDGVVNGAIRRGLAVLVAVEEADTGEDIEWLSGKIVRLRVFDDENGVMNRSVQEVQGGILLVSQFTLFASTKKGNRPSYSRSAKPEIAVPIYRRFVERLGQDLGQPVQTGEFGAQMLVSLTNDGPVTIIIDSKARE